MVIFLQKIADLSKPDHSHLICRENFQLLIHLSACFPLTHTPAPSFSCHFDPAHKDIGMHWRVLGFSLRV